MQFSTGIAGPAENNRSIGLGMYSFGLCFIAHARDGFVLFSLLWRLKRQDRCKYSGFFCAIFGGGQRLWFVKFFARLRFVLDGGWSRVGCDWSGESCEVRFGEEQAGCDQYFFYVAIFGKNRVLLNPIKGD